MDVRSGSHLRTLVNLPVSISHAHIRGSGHLVAMGQDWCSAGKLVIFSKGALLQPTRCGFENSAVAPVALLE